LSPQNTLSALPREIAGIRLPDSALARKAVDLTFHVSPAVVWTHVLRTFVFGALVGRVRNLHYDEELFFLASVLHDLGLTAEFRRAERFEVVGADAADAFLKDQGVDPERREVIWDAIALHTSIGIASRKRPEIALVHIGAGVDVFLMPSPAASWQPHRAACGFWPAPSDERERWFRVVMGENEVARLIASNAVTTIPLPRTISDELNFKLGLPNFS
jgi:HD domain